MRRYHIGPIITALVAATAFAGVAQAQGDQGRGRGRGHAAVRRSGQANQGRAAPDATTTAGTSTSRRVSPSNRRRSCSRPSGRRSIGSSRNTPRNSSDSASSFAPSVGSTTSRTWSPSPTYRYQFNGAYHETNQYGVDMLRQAVNYGYQRGYQAGAADRQDHWRFDYQNSPEYREATFGYGGSYVDLSDYSYYFRQGFSRGYQDGYYSRLRYGSGSNGTFSILANVLGGILHLSNIR